MNNINSVKISSQNLLIDKNTSVNLKNKENTNVFSDILNNTVNKSQITEELQFSKHASMRLDSRNIKLSQEQLQRVEKGVLNARQKGINDSLVLVDNVALVVNVKNKIVITAMNENNNIFTNIDGAVIV